MGWEGPERSDLLLGGHVLGGAGWEGTNKTCSFTTRGVAGWEDVHPEIFRVPPTGRLAVGGWGGTKRARLTTGVARVWGRALGGSNKTG